MLDSTPKRQCQAFLIKLADASGPATYSIVMGCSMTLLAINGEAVEFERIGDALRSLIDNPASLTINAEGTIENLARVMRIEAAAKATLPERAELYFDGGMRLRGRFTIPRFEFVAFRFGEAVYGIALESVGACDVT